MQDSDFNGIRRSGALARESGVSFFDNPHYVDDDEWFAPASAWAAGWREADRGRDAALTALDRIRYW